MLGPIAAFAVVVADQWTKAWAYGRQSQYGTPQVLMPGVCELRLTTNHGAVGGLFADTASQTLSMALVLSGIVVGTLLLRCSLRAVDRCSSLGVGLMLGGVTGNTIDRLHWGYVIDFIHIRSGDLWSLGTLNAADLAIVCGLALLVPQFVRPRSPKVGLPTIPTPDS